MVSAVLIMAGTPVTFLNHICLPRIWGSRLPSLLLRGDTDPLLMILR